MHSADLYQRSPQRAKTSFWCSLFSPNRFSVSNSMVRWINLSLLCAVWQDEAPASRLTEFVWLKMTSKTICLSYPSVIAQRLPSAEHHSKTTASRGWRGWGRGWETERAGEMRWATRRCKRVKRSVWMWMSGYTIKMKGVKGGECPSLSRTASLPVTDCFSRRKCPVSSNKLHHFPFFSLWWEIEMHQH